MIEKNFRPGQLVRAGERKDIRHPLEFLTKAALLRRINNEAGREELVSVQCEEIGLVLEILIPPENLPRMPIAYVLFGEVIAAVPVEFIRSMRGRKP